MQFSAIITLLATATAVFGTAIPNAAPDAAPAPSPNGQPPATNKCSQGTSTQCCDKTFLSGIGGLIGINCLPVNGESFRSILLFQLRLVFSQFFEQLPSTGRGFVSMRKYADLRVSQCSLAEPAALNSSSLAAPPAATALSTLGRSAPTFSFSK